MIFTPDERVGKYRIIGQLGQGGMGEVYLAEDVNLHREVALKILQKSLSGDEKFKEQFRHEARSISRIVHPNIVQIHNMEEIDGRLVIDMEYVEGQSFSNVIKKGPVAPHLVSSVALDVLHGLSVCHQAGVVHRDIKPSNILLTVGGQAKIVDFGIAKALADSSAASLETSASTTIYMGTPRYTPPEAWDGAAATPQWDLYALGIMLYEALNGKPAFNARTMYSLMREVFENPLPPIRENVNSVSTEFAEFIDALVHPDPACRCENSTLALTQLKRSLELSDHDRLETPTITIPKMKPLKRTREASRARIKTAGVLAALVIIPLLTIYLSRAGVISFRGALPGNSAGGTGFLPTPAAVDRGTIPVWRAENISPESDSGWDMLWARSTPDTPERIIAFNATGILYLDVVKQGTRFSLDGEWASYGSVAGIGFQSGQVSGFAVKHNSQTAFTFTLHFLSIRDRSEWDNTFYVSKQPALTSRQDLVRTFESDPWLPNLLHNEILPRRTLSLGPYMESLLPASPNQRVLVPYVAQGSGPTIDGELTDQVWTEKFFGKLGREGELSSSTRSNSIPLLLRHDGKTLFVAVRVPGKNASEWGAEIVLRQSISKPLSDSPYTVLSVSTSNDPVMRHYVRGREEPLTNSWSSAANLVGDTLIIELAVPFDDTIDILGSSCLRLTATTWHADDNGERSAGVFWGSDTSRNIEHGALLNLSGTLSQ